MCVLAHIFCSWNGLRNFLRWSIDVRDSHIWPNDDMTAAVVCCFLLSECHHQRIRTRLSSAERIWCLVERINKMIGWNAFKKKKKKVIPEFLGFVLRTTEKNVDIHFTLDTHCATWNKNILTAFRHNNNFANAKTMRVVVFFCCFAKCTKKAWPRNLCLYWLLLLADWLADRYYSAFVWLHFGKGAEWFEINNKFAHSTQWESYRQLMALEAIRPIRTHTHIYCNW